MSTFFDRAMRIGFVIAIVFSALAHGAVEGWSKGILELLILVLAALWLVRGLVRGKFELAVPRTFWPLAAFLILGFAQTYSWTGADGRLHALSFDREATYGSAILLFFLTIAHLAGFNFWNDQAARLQLVRTLIVFGVIIAVLSIIQGAAGNQLFFWYRSSTNAGKYGSWLTGPFVNHNHLAGYLELFVMLPLGFLATGHDRQYRILYIFAFIIMAAVIVLSASRGGIISTVTALLCFGLIAYFSKKDEPRSFFRRPDERASGDRIDTDADRRRVNYWQKVKAPVLVLLIAFNLAAFLVWLGLNPVVERVTNTQLLSDRETAQSFEGSRGWIWRNSWTMFTANTITGVGLGAYLTAFPIYASSDGVREFGTKYLIDRVHNDYLQILTDTGLAGGVFALIFLILLVGNIYRAALAAGRPLDPAAPGLACALIALLVHSVFDFNLQLASTSLLFLLMAALIERIGDERAAGAA